MRKRSSSAAHARLPSPRRPGRSQRPHNVTRFNHPRDLAALLCNFFLNASALGLQPSGRRSLSDRSPKAASATYSNHRRAGLSSPQDAAIRTRFGILVRLAHFEDHMHVLKQSINIHIFCFSRAASSRRRRPTKFRPRSEISLAIGVTSGQSSRRDYRRRGKCDFLLSMWRCRR